MVFMDGTIINVALPAIGEDLDTGLSGLQWTVNAYTLTLAGLLLLGGALGDRYGRRRIYVIGVVWFAAASLLCAVAPSANALIAGRALQGVGGALLTPGSLSILEATFAAEDRSAAIGAWSGMSGVATAIGPLLGGWLIGASTWRLIFLLNLPFAAGVVYGALRYVPETRSPLEGGSLDVAGGLLAAIGLAGVVDALTYGPVDGWSDPRVVSTGLIGVLALSAFVVRELRIRHPMLPFGIFRSRQFSGANGVTLVVYGALSAAVFLLPIQLQRVLGYSPLQSGAAFVPVTVLMFLLSPRAGRLADRIGPRPMMTAGPIVLGIGLALMARITPGSSYVEAVLPSALIFGLGLSTTVAPLTATVLAAADEEYLGVASAVNNTVSRVGGLLAVAAIPIVAGVSGMDALAPDTFSAGFQRGVVIAGVVCALGGVLAFLTIRNELRPEAQPEPEPGAA
jgi:EmrB/QacA subfamily drug resistance transporter